MLICDLPCFLISDDFILFPINTAGLCTSAHDSQTAIWKTSPPISPVSRAWHDNLIKVRPAQPCNIRDAGTTSQALKATLVVFPLPVGPLRPLS